MLKSLVFVWLAASVFLFTGFVSAQQANTLSAQSVLRNDRQELQTRKGQIKKNSKIAKQKEQDLRSQIQQAIQAGDQQKAQELRAKLRVMHQENIQQRQQDKQDLRQDCRELRSGMKGAGIRPGRGPSGGGQRGGGGKQRR